MKIGLFHTAAKPAETLIIMLPGGLMTPQHYVDAGFVSALEQSRCSADLQLPEFNFNRINITAILPPILKTLHRDIIQPAQQRGYRNIVLGGISLGGAVAMHYVREYPSEVDSLCLLAPYPGSRLTTGAILAAGGIDAWKIGDKQSQDPEFLLWDWLSRQSDELPIYLGFGREDRFADGLNMIVAALTAAQLTTVPGGHDWQAWRALWNDYLTTCLPNLIGK